MTYQVEINFGQGWEASCYHAMDKISAERLAKRLGGLYTQYRYRVVPG